ncbi:hypothetical protein RZS08_04785, partial [Arthrospira platensis SPKY1]|nr:hypothetical protein [Arthrospira platensis SPKY1]
MPAARPSRRARPARDRKARPRWRAATASARNEPRQAAASRRRPRRRGRLLAPGLRPVPRRGGRSPRLRSSVS